MICDKCKIAGDINQRLNDNPEATPIDKAAIEFRAKQLHNQCYSHDCMCQHRTGVYVARGQEARSESGEVSSPAGSGSTGGDSPAA